MEITRTSMFTGKIHTLDLPVTQAQIDLWEGGLYAQDAFPHLSPDEREFIMTGVTAQEWDERFSF